MRQLLPEAIDDVDPVAAYGADARPAPPGRPWVLVNMIASIDGATTLGSVSGPLGGPADRRVFAAIRAVADVVLVGAGTVRAERYGPARARDGTERPPPRIAVVTASCDLDPGLRVFAEAAADQPPPIVFTCAAGPADRRAALAEVAEVVVAGEALVDLVAALGELAGRGARVVLCEGGPTLNGQLVAADLVDEWCASIAPFLVASASSRPAVGAPTPAGAVALRLDRLLAEDDLLFGRYVRRDA